MVVDAQNYKMDETGVWFGFQFLKFNQLILSLCVMYGGVCVKRLEDNLQESILSYHVGHRVHIQVVRLGTKSLFTC